MKNKKKNILRADCLKSLKFRRQFQSGHYNLTVGKWVKREREPR